MKTNNFKKINSIKEYRLCIKFFKYNLLKIISYLTALKNSPDEMDATDILSLTGQGNGNMKVIGLEMYLENKIRLNMF